MSQKLRQEQILHILQERGYVTVRYLTNTLHYSSATVNRDLNAMQTLGLVKRTYGGVEAVDHHNFFPLPQRQLYMKKEKRRNAHAAAALIENGDTVYLDASTSVQYIAPFLAEKRDLTVITNNMRLAIELGEYDMDVICLGGHIHAGGNLGADPVDGAVYVTGSDQHGAQHQFLHRVGVGTGGIEDNDTGLRAAVQGNVVHTGTCPGDGQKAVRKSIVMEFGGADKNGILVGAAVADLIEILIEGVQAYGRNLVHGFDLVHGRASKLADRWRSEYLQGNVRRWRRFPCSILIIIKGENPVNGGTAKSQSIIYRFFGAKQ